MRMCHFWDQNSPLAQMRIFSVNLLISLTPFIQAYLRVKNQSQIFMIKEYWNIIGQETFLAITWEPDFSQACSFRRILMNHKNFRFAQIPDKTNDVIFLKSPLGHFWPFLVIFARWGFFPKIPALSHINIYGPLTPC